jgi:luciferase-like monooxygenase
VRFGVTLPNMGVGSDPEVLVDLAVEAENAGWEGVFIWDAPFGGSEYGDEVQVIHDAWVALSAMAVRTERVLLGTMITPLPWRTPGMVARQAATLNELSRGRFVLAVGLGYPPPGGMYFHEETDRRTRARMLDEGLEIIAGLWTGKPFTFDGEHYRVREVRLQPAPDPRIPVWVVGAWHTDPDAWPKRKSLRRALRWDGVLPNVFRPTGRSRPDLPDSPVMDPGPDDMRAMTDWIRAERPGPFDIVMEGGSQTDENTTPEVVAEWRDAGATWWLEPVWWAMYRHPGDPSAMRERIKTGPPRL